MAILIKVPKELTEYKGGVFLGLNGRQLLCFAIAGAIGLPLYIIGKKYIGEDLASWAVIILAMPCFAFGVLRPGGLPFEKYLLIVIRHRFTPQIRRYGTYNLYDELIQQEERSNEIQAAQETKAKRAAEKRHSRSKGSSAKPKQAQG